MKECKTVETLVATEGISETKITISSKDILKSLPQQI